MNLPNFCDQLMNNNVNSLFYCRQGFPMIFPQGGHFVPLTVTWGVICHSRGSNYNNYLIKETTTDLIEETITDLLLLTCYLICQF